MVRQGGLVSFGKGRLVCVGVDSVGQDRAGQGRANEVRACLVFKISLSHNMVEKRSVGESKMETCQRKEVR